MVIIPQQLTPLQSWQVKQAGIRHRATYEVGDTAPRSMWSSSRLTIARDPYHKGVYYLISMAGTIQQVGTYSHCKAHYDDAYPSTCPQCGGNANYCNYPDCNPLELAEVWR